MKVRDDDSDDCGGEKNSSDCKSSECVLVRSRNVIG